jgi:hypothetical protein
MWVALAIVFGLVWLFIGGALFGIYVAQRRH